MTNLAKLYAKSSTGKVLEWSIEIEDNKYRTIAGQQDGKKVISEWTECFGKNIGKSNETSNESQAQMEAEALWEKKIKRHGYWQDIKDIDKTTFVEPMLAKKYVDRKHLIDWAKGIIVQTKFNGLRCIATKNGLHTRKGERYISVPHIEKSLKPFFDKFPDAVLDGELFNNDYRQQLNEIVKLCRKTVDVTTEDLKRSEELVKYYIYDGYNFKLMNQLTGYYLRKDFINNISLDHPHINRVDCKYAYSEEQLEDAYNDLIADGQEGCIVRFPNSPYENKRSGYLLKYKPTDNSEYVIINIQEGVGNWSGKAKIITLKDENGKQFNASFKGTMTDAIECLKEKNKWIGKEVEICYNGLTGLGTPNYAQFNYRNCLKGDR